MKGQAIEMTPWDIAEGIRTWHAWPGFSGEWCHSCHAEINTFAGGSGYFCPRCDSYNAQSFSGHFMPHVKPEFGPTRSTIRKGGKLAERHSRKAQKFTVGQKVWANRDSYGGYNQRTRVEAGRIVAVIEWYPFMTAYQVQFEDGKIVPHIRQTNICARPRGSEEVRQMLFDSKGWTGPADITTIDTWEIERETIFSRLR